MRSHPGRNLGKKNPMYNKQHTEHTKQLQKERALNRKRMTCEYCTKETSPSNYVRWHGINCRHKYKSR
jgi:hypothetical protein